MIWPSGAQNDLQQVTKMATAMIRQMGMSERMGHVSFPVETDGGFGKKPYSKYLAAVMDEVQINNKTLFAVAIKGPSHRHMTSGYSLNMLLHVYKIVPYLVTFH